MRHDRVLHLMQTRRKDGADARVFELHGYEMAHGDQTLLEII
jgi:hypothetical protein